MEILEKGVFKSPYDGVKDEEVILQKDNGRYYVYVGGVPVWDDDSYSQALREFKGWAD